jgi:dolichol kinase
MNAPWLASGIFLLLFLVIIVAAQLIYKAGMPAEVSRKFVHVCGGILSLFLPSFIDSPWYVLGLCAIAFFVLLFTWFRKKLGAIHKTQRRSIGSIVFPIPVYICFAMYNYYDNPLIFYIPVSLLTFADTMAEIGGKNWGRYGPVFFGGRKSLVGSLCFLGTAVVILAVMGVGWITLLTIAAVATVAELVSVNGWDNVTVPLVGLGVLMVHY